MRVAKYKLLVVARSPHSSCGESFHGKQAMYSMRQGVSATTPSSTAMLLCGASVSARASAALATGQAPERPRLQRKPDTRTTRMAKTQSRLLARIPPHTCTVFRAKPRTATRAQQPATRAPDCKDGRLNTGFPHAHRYLPDQPGPATWNCKNGLVDSANYCAISNIRSGSQRLQREDVIGVTSCDGYCRAF